MISTCISCKGSGKITFKPLDGFQNYQWTPWETKKCPTCKGKGTVNDNRTI